MRNKHEAKTQVCWICGAAYGTTKSLKYHVATVSCHYKFLVQLLMVTPNTQHSSAELTCDFCLKRFIHKQSILKHIKT